MTDRPRTEILARVKGAVHTLPAAQVAAELDSLGAAAAAPLPSESLAAAFLARVIQNQGTVDCAGSRSEAVKAIGRYIYRNHQSHKIVASRDPRLAAMPWRDGGVLPRFETAANGDSAALSYARLGVAETGSVVTFTGKWNPSANNLLVEDHLVLLDATSLVATFEQAWAQIDALIEKDGRPRGINFISGPSSTADIVGHLVMGAHGPTRWHLILLGDLPADLLAQAHQVAGNAATN